MPAHILQGRAVFQGMDISIENKKGTKRTWRNHDDGTEGFTVMKADYGYVKSTEGTDGDAVDVYLGDNPDAPDVYIVTQMKSPEFKNVDEQKCFLGLDSEADAKKLYLAHMDNPRFFGNIKTMSVEEFKEKVYKKSNRGKLIKNLAEVFTSWGPVLRKASTDDAYMDKMQEVSILLTGKTGSDITFTASESDGSLSQYILGSFEGNAKFLLGYVNPGFCVAPYHYRLIDPSMSEEDALLLYETKGHPAMPVLWLNVGLTPFSEGDPKEGSPHPEFSKVPLDFNLPKPVSVSFMGGKFTGDPTEQVVYSKKTDHKYAWSLIKDTFFANKNKKLKDAMDLGNTAYAKSLRHVEQWDEDVYPLVKSFFPKPGSIIRMEKGIYGIIKKDSVDFIELSGRPVSYEIWDRDATSLSFLRDGHGLPSAILSFAKSYLGLDTASLLSMTGKE